MAGEVPPIEYQHFDSDDAALQFFKSRADDVAQVGIPVGSPVTVVRQGHAIGPLPGIAMVVFMVNGDLHLLTAPRAERVLNDGILHRMRIRIRILEPEA